MQKTVDLGLTWILRVERLCNLGALPEKSKNSESEQCYSDKNKQNAQTMTSMYARSRRSSYDPLYVFQPDRLLLQTHPLIGMGNINQCPRALPD